jgi:ketosteroid isomerase-like protein
MKNFAIVLLFILTFSFTAFGQRTVKAKTVAVRADAKKGVQAAFERLTDGIRQADAKKVMSVYENSDRILFFNNNGTATIGWENMRANRESLYAKTRNVTLDITGLRIEMLAPDAAYVTCKWKQTQEYSGKLESASGRMTLVFRLVGKEWKVAHLHTSPDNPDATRPVFPSEREATQQ